MLKASAWVFKQTGAAPSYLHEHFQAVQGSCTGSGHGTCTSTCNQMSPPHPCLPLFHCELIRDSQILSYVKDLQKYKVLRNVSSASDLAKVLLLFISAKYWTTGYAIPSQQLIYGQQLPCLVTGTATAIARHRGNLKMQRLLSKKLATTEHLSALKYCGS